MLRFPLAQAALGLAAILMVPWAACTQPPPAAAPPPAPPPYQPNFSYKAPAADKKLDVTIGVVNPQFASSASSPDRRGYLGDTVVKGMLSAMSATFNEVLIAKGFNTKGPFTSLNDMTFPDKKGSDLLLYPEFDYDVTVKVTGEPHAAAGAAAPGDKGSMFGGLLKTNDAKPAGAAPVPQVCDLSLVTTGNVLFIAQEPLSGESFMKKRLDLSSSAQTFKDQECSLVSKPSDQWPQDLKDAWGKAHEAVYQNSMKAFDNYVNGEEFQVFKKQAQEVRDKKSY
jgi:hypothetical protein